MRAPNWGIPPDLIVSPIEEISIMGPPSVWHLPSDTWAKIWKRFRGQGERIAILDTGYTPHNDLPTPIAQRSFISGQDVRDGNAHGTHCAGTALGRNGIGVAPEAEYIVGKCLSNQGSGSSTAIGDSVLWAIDQGATIISMSLGGGSPHEPTRKAIQKANDAGIIVFAAAGNAGQRLPNNTIGYPGRHVETFCVGSIDQQGNASSFSSAGRELDGATPGSNIVSCSNTDSNGYRGMSGTSMATPFMAGLGAVIRSGMAMAGATRLGGVDDWRNWMKIAFKDVGAPGNDPIYGIGVPDYVKILTLLLREDIYYV